LYRPQRHASVQETSAHPPRSGPPAGR